RAGVRRALRAELPPEGRVHDLGGEDPARPSLVDRRADVRRSLHMLDGPEAAGDRVEDVPDGLVTLEIDEVPRVVVGRDLRHRRPPEVVARSTSDDGEPWRPLRGEEHL